MCTRRNWNHSAKGSRVNWRERVKTEKVASWGQWMPFWGRRLIAVSVSSEILHKFQRPNPVDKWCMKFSMAAQQKLISIKQLSVARFSAKTLRDIWAACERETHARWAAAAAGGGGTDSYPKMCPRHSLKKRAKRVSHLISSAKRSTDIADTSTTTATDTSSATDTFVHGTWTTCYVSSMLQFAYFWLISWK